MKYILLSIRCLCMVGMLITTGKLGLCQDPQSSEKSSKPVKTFSVDVKKIPLQEKMTFDVDLSQEEIINSILPMRTSADGRWMNIKDLHARHGKFKEISTIRHDFIEANYHDEPPEDYIYLYEIKKPLQYVGWNLKIINSKGENIWTAGGSSNPPYQLVWNGYDKNGNWSVSFGENYTFVFEARDNKTNKLVVLEEPFTVQSYIMNTNTYVIISFSTSALFDTKGFNMTDTGKKMLSKVCYKIKSSQYKHGVMELKTTNTALADLQMEKVIEFAKENMVNLNTLKTKVKDSPNLTNHFEIILQKL